MVGRVKHAAQHEAGSWLRDEMSWMLPPATLMPYAGSGFGGMSLSRDLLDFADVSLAEFLHLGASSIGSLMPTIREPVIGLERSRFAATDVSHNTSNLWQSFEAAHSGEAWKFNPADSLPRSVRTRIDADSISVQSLPTHNIGLSSMLDGPFDRHMSVSDNGYVDCVPTDMLPVGRKLAVYRVDINTSAGAVDATVFMEVDTADLGVFLSVHELIFNCGDGRQLGLNLEGHKTLEPVHQISF